MRKRNRNYTAIGVPTGEPTMKRVVEPLKGEPVVKQVEAKPVVRLGPAQEVKQPPAQNKAWLKEVASSRPRPKDKPMHESGMD